ncbi:hypothetical protein [Nocardia alni]|uniref:hypothetical protein n=1 Tax=Nocardia alni TaxID=2815723 RepID=UPI001C212E62|nr:hypothetical protein [Nocardia alni]
MCDSRIPFAIIDIRIALGMLFNVVDDESLTHRDYDDAPGRRRYLRLPGRSALLSGDQLTSLTRSLRVSNAVLRQVGWTPRYPSAHEGPAATARALQRTGPGSNL